MVSQPTQAETMVTRHQTGHNRKEITSGVGGRENKVQDLMTENRRPWPDA